MNMREILFKAKRIDNGEWLEGVPVDARPEEMTGIGYIPHWSTCPQANNFRRR